MSDDALSREELEVVRKLANKWNINLEKKEVVGPQASFASMEMTAHRMGQAVARELCEDFAAKQAELAEGPQPCPTCGRSCETEFRERKLTTVDGIIDLHEAVCHCSACRRDFFPSACPVGTASARL